MARTTVSIDDPVLRDLKRLQKKERKPLGQLMSELLTDALARRQEAAKEVEPPFKWHSQPMGFKIDLEDKDAVWALLDREDLDE